VLAKALAQAHAALGYDLLTLMPEEQQWLGDHDAPAPAQNAVIGNRVRSVTVSTKNGPVGFILLPKLPRNATIPLDMTMRAIEDQARSLAGRTRLVVGISPWGGVAEDHFLQKKAHVLDILLGAGPGPGLAGRFTPDGKTFWARSYGRGKALHVVRISEWPQRSADWKWIKDGNLRLDFMPLNEPVPSDPEMNALLGEFNLPR